MPDSCCVPNCTNRQRKGDSGGFYKITSKKYPDLRERWLAAIRRIQWSDELIKNAKVCFVSGNSTFWLKIFLPILLQNYKIFIVGAKSKEPTLSDVLSVFNRTGKRLTEKRKNQKHERYLWLAQRRAINEKDDYVIEEIEEEEVPGPSGKDSRLFELEEQVKTLTQKIQKKQLGECENLIFWTPQYQ